MESRAVEKLNAKGANGFANWKSYILNMNPTDATDKPFIQAKADDSNENSITFNFFHGVGKHAIEPRTGVKVVFSVEESSSLDFSGAKTTAATGDAKLVTVDLPFDPAGTKVRYYRPKFTFE